MPLTDLAIRRAKPEAKHYRMTDSAGLYIEVCPTGSKLWRYRYRIAGKEGTFALGAYPEVTLSEAREARDEARKLVRQGQEAEAVGVAVTHPSPFSGVILL